MSDGPRASLSVTEFHGQHHEYCQQVGTRYQLTQSSQSGDLSDHEFYSKINQKQSA
jgi:hypothetical protein